MRVFECDHYLPQLPVPELPDTCQNLKELTKPLIEKSEWESLCAELNSFQQEEGSRLQDLLLQWKSEQEGNASWLRPIWDDSYLSYRDRLPINMNYTFQLLKERWGGLATAKLLRGLCCILDKIRVEDLPTEKIRETPLSMDTLSYMIYTRIPELQRDLLYHLPLTGPYTAAVVCRGQWFLLSLTDSRSNILAPEAIQKSLDNIRQNAQPLPDLAPMGALTCAPRAEAAMIRSRLQEHPLNRISLQQLENAVCVVCLDETAPDSFVQELILGRPANRWYDKSLQIICDGSNLGLSIEHSGCDGGIWVYLLSLVDDCIMQDSSAAPEPITEAYVRPLRWHLSTETAGLLNQVLADYQTAAAGITASEKRISCLSRSNIKTVNCRPDALAHALYQAAYYKLTGRFRSTYEAAATRAYYQGRTECVRPCTEAAADFALALTEKTDSPEVILEKYRRSEQAHMAQISRCQQGLGAERHMSGLAAMYRMFYDENSTMPAVFSSIGYQTLGHSAVSTSSTTASYIDYFGFGPVVTDGIGIGYGIKNDALHIAVSAYPDSTIKPEEFLNTLETLAKEFFELF